MNSGFYRYAIGLALLTAPAIAGARGITYDCDTAADHYSELDLPVDAGAFTVSGKVQLKTLAAIKTFIPLARVQITSPTVPGKGPDVYAGFVLSALPADATKTPSGEPSIQMLGYSVNGKEDDILPFSLMTKPGTIQAFSLSYDGTKVLVNLGNESKSFPLKTKDPIVRLVCSTGEFLFTDVTITPSR